MPTFYMIFWSMMMILTLGLWRLRHWGHILVVTAVTALTLILSQALFIQFSLTAGVDPNQALTNPGYFLSSGPLAWAALLIMPCGWLGPFIGFNLVQRWNHFEEIV